ncbi:MAG: AsmA family protein, partial [Desulfovibrio sp.]|nr:AsmA family protein [Desulfovibrio sp.]
SDARVRIEGGGKGLPISVFLAQGRGDVEILAEENRITGRKMALSGSASGGVLPGGGLDAGLELSFDYDYGKGLASCPALVLTVPKAGLTAKGTFEASGLGAAPRATFALAAAPFDAKSLLAMTGVSLPAMRDKNALSKVGFTLNAAYLENKQTRLETDLSLDGSPIRVTAQAATGEKTRIAAGVDIQALNLTGYLPPSGDSGAKDAGPRKKGAAPGQNLFLDLRVSAKRLDVDKLSLTGVELAGTFDGGVTTVSRLRTGLFGGSITASGRTDGRQPTTALAVRAEGSGIQAGPLLKALTDKEPLTGTAGFRADLTAAGNDQAAVLRTLSGTVSANLKNGRIAGLSLTPDILSAPQRLFSFGAGGDAGGDRKEGQDGSLITSAGLSANLRNGVATTRDILVQAPPHKVTGQGSINLPAQALDLRLTAHVAGVADIPVTVAGTFSDPSVTPDLAAIPAAAIGGAAGKAAKVLTDPAGAAKDVLDAVNPLNLLPFGGDKKK